MKITTRYRTELKNAVSTLLSNAAIATWSPGDSPNGGSLHGPDEETRLEAAMAFDFFLEEVTGMLSDLDRLVNLDHRDLATLTSLPADEAEKILNRSSGTSIRPDGIVAPELPRELQPLIARLRAAGGAS